MKSKQKGFVGIIIIVLIALAALGGGAYIYSQKLEVNSESSSQVSTETKADTLSTTTEQAQVKTETKQVVPPPTVTVKTVSNTPVSNGEKPDLTVEDIQIYEPLSASQRTIGFQELTAKICNRGKVGINTGNLTKEPEKISISFKLNGTTAYSNKSISSILAGNCDPLVGFYVVELNASYGPFKGIKSGNYNVTAKVDAESKVDESDEDNNSFTKNIYLDFEPTVKKLTVISPTSNSVWKEGNEYTISWQAFSGEVARYYVSIGNYGSQTSMGLPTTYSKTGIGNQTSLVYKVEKGLVSSMFMGEPKGKTASGIKNDFYFEVTATNSNGDQIGSGRTSTFTIEP